MRLFSFILFFLLFGCTNRLQNVSFTYTVEIDDIDAIDDDNSVFFKLTNVFQITPDIPIGEISRLIVSDGNYYILTRQTNEIHKFNSKGELVNTLKTIGHGPDEYVQISDFGLDSEEEILIVYDEIGAKVIEYNLDLGFLKSYAFKFRGDQIVTDRGSLFIFVGRYGGNFQDSIRLLYEVLRVNPDASVDGHFPFTRDEDGTLDLDVYCDAQLIHNESGIYLTRSFDFSVYTYQGKAGFIPKWSIDLKGQDLGYIGITYDEFMETLNSKIMYFDRYTVLDEILLAQFSLGEKNYSIFSQYQNQTVVIRNLTESIIAISEGGPIPVPYYSCQGKIFGIVEPWQLFELLEDSENSKLILDFITQLEINADSNPILIEFEVLIDDQ